MINIARKSFYPRVACIMFVSLFFGSSITHADSEGINTGANLQTFYSLYDDGGEHLIDACNKVNVLPKMLSKKSLKTKLASYLGSQQIEFADKNEAAIDAFEHYFLLENDCNTTLKHLQKNYGY
jgi:hypothetical protein